MRKSVEKNIENIFMENYKKVFYGKFPESVLWKITRKCCMENSQKVFYGKFPVIVSSKENERGRGVENFFSFFFQFFVKLKQTLTLTLCLIFSDPNPNTS